MNKWIAHIALLKRLYKEKRFYPISIQFNLTNKCWCRCIMCKKFTWPQEILSVDTILNTINMFRDTIETVVFSGGEPFLYPHIYELFKKLPDDIEYGILTSGIFSAREIDSEKVKLIGSKCRWVRFSIDAADINTYEKIRGVSILELALNNLERFSKYTNTRVNVVLCKENLSVEQIKLMFKVFSKYTNSIYFFPVHTFIDQIPTEVNEVIEALKKELDNDLEFKSIVANMNTNLFNMLFPNQLKSQKCIVPFIHFIVDADGLVWPCCRVLNDNDYYDRVDKNLSYCHVRELDNYIKTEEFRTKLLTYFDKQTKFCEGCDRYQEFNYTVEQFTYTKVFI